MILPQGRRACVLQHLEGADGIGGEQHAARQGGAAQPQPADDAVVEAVHRAAALVRTALQGGKQHAVELGRERFHFDEHFERQGNRVQRLIEGGDRLAVGEAQGADFRSRGSRDVPAAHDFVVVDDQGAVLRGVDVELHAVGAPRRRGAEGGERVLQLVPRRAAVRDDQRPGHCWLSSVSAFLGSIQSGSFSMSCTSAMSSGRGRTFCRYAAYCSTPISSPSTVQCCRAYWPIRRLNLSSGTLSHRSLSAMNMLRRSTSFTISWRYRPREASFSFCLSASAWFSRSS